MAGKRGVGWRGAVVTRAKPHVPQIDSAGVAEIDSLSHDGRGVAHVGGKAVFIDGGVPGDVVRYEVIRSRRSHDNARVAEVLTPSPDRVANPHCAAFGTCGGCTLQHLTPDAQLRAKQRVLLDSLKHIGKVVPEEILAPLTGPGWGYRRKARLGVRNVPKKGGILVGFREKAKSYIADMLRCEVLIPAVGELLPELRTVVSELSCAERVPQIEVAAGDTAVVLVFRHLVPLTDGDRERLVEFGKTHQLEIRLQPAGPDSVQDLWPSPGTPLSYALPAHHVEILFEPTDFIQVNGPINRAMVDRAVELLAPAADENVLDLFCGLGNFTLPLARYARQVVGVEGEAGLIQRARSNATHNSIRNAEFHVGDLYQEPLDANWLNRRYDKILLDPPRTGAVEIVKRLPELGARRIVYVSCNPGTLARDAQVLVHVYKYRMCAAGIMDMFPHTTHVESIVVFEPGV